MQITRQADYAVRAILHLAHIKNGERAATSNVACMAKPLDLDALLAGVAQAMRA